jgi:cobalt-zinc-cadmium efflux system outer membrane protein
MEKMFESRGAALAALIFLVLVKAPCSADEPCQMPFTAAKVVSCALSISPEVQIARCEFDALRGRRSSAGIWLPSNPNISFNGGDRDLAERPGGVSAFNWAATLSQEVEVAGQRSLRLRVADAELAAQTRRVVVTELDVAARALATFFEVRAAREELGLAERLGRIAQSLSELAEQRSKIGLLSPVDADVAQSESIRIGVIRYETRRRFYSAQVNLNGLLGRDFAAPVEVVDSLRPPLIAPPEVRAGASSFVSRALLLRGEIAAADAERRVFETQLQLIRRERIPNPTLSIYRQRDELRDRIFGGGISMAIPLPAPLGQDKAGEIEETIARIGQASSNVELVKRNVRIEAERAYEDWQTSSEALTLFQPELVGRANDDLDLIREAIGSRQLSLRDALLAQRSLVDLLLADIEARLNYSQAWANLMRVGGYPLPGMNQ